MMRGMWMRAFVAGLLALAVRAGAEAEDEAADVEARVRAWMPDRVALSEVFQYAVPHGESGRMIYLWLPPQAERLRGLIVGGDLMMESNFVVDPVIREACADQAIGILFSAKGIPTGKVLEDALGRLGEAANHPELLTAPIMPIGHSAASTSVPRILHSMPDRCFAGLTYKGAAPIDPGKATEKVRGIPNLHVQDFVEEYKNRRETGSLGRMNVAGIRAKDPQVLSGIVEDNGSKHAAWCFRLTPLLAEFIRASAALRIDAEGNTRPVPAEAGALADKQFVAPRHPTAPAAEYEGDPKEAMWYPSLKMAQMLTDYNKVQLGKQAQYVAFARRDGKPVREKASPPLRFVEPDVFQVQAVYLDKAANPVLPQDPVTHADGPILFAAHGRKLKLVGPGRFRLYFHPQAVRWYRISCYSMGDARHRFDEVISDLRLPGQEGAEQTLDFAAEREVARKDFPLTLDAVSSAKLPVRYTVEYGPARVDEDGRLVLTELPVCSAFPMQVAVWAYQYGSYVEPRVKGARPVRQVITVTE